MKTNKNCYCYSYQLGLFYVRKWADGTFMVDYDHERVMPAHFSATDLELNIHGTRNWYLVVQGSL